MEATELKQLGERATKARLAIVGAIKRTRSGAPTATVPMPSLGHMLTVLSETESLATKLAKAEARTGELQAELAEQETAALQWTKTLASYQNEISRLRADYDRSGLSVVCIHQLALNGAITFEQSLEMLKELPSNEWDQYNKLSTAPTPPPSSPAAAGPGEPVLIDACEVCAYRQPEDAERPCPRCGNGIYVAMTVGKAYETAKEWAHPTKKPAGPPTTGEGGTRGE